MKESADDFTQIAEKDIDITSGNGSHFWWNICYWKYVINSIYNGKRCEFMDKNELPEVKFNQNILDDIAYVNIKKKCDNKTKSNDGEIFSFAIEDKELLIEQIELINPNIVLCNHITFRSYCHLYGDEIEKLNEVCYKHNDRLILNFRHPSYFQIKGGRKTHFSDLKSALLDKNALDLFNWTK
ncbi:hypothetical protein [Labilibacter marinus]|uniref:hypothetical protein n=1 Tax=Labilibacter marinus TaxID=1477105 RepID=UPI0011799700|nr:hypothetical protein [Labilibacter marinus]